MLRLPAFPPRPPFLQEQEEEEEDEDEEEKDVSNDFRRKMESEGFDPALVKMGIKVANNHMRPPEQAFRIGENYIREMSK